jgi:hypothetical protein
MRILDLGFVIRPLPQAAVHHKYLASHLRSARKVILNPYPLVKNRCYFALQNGQEGRSLRTVKRLLSAYADGLRAECDAHFAAGLLTEAQQRFFHRQLERGLHDGTERGLHGGRQWRVIPPADRERFLPHPILRPAQTRRTVCLLSPGPADGGPRTGGAAAGRGVLSRGRTHPRRHARRRCGRPAGNQGGPALRPRSALHDRAG